jgi:hypothetical protein
MWRSTVGYAYTSDVRGPVALVPTKVRDGPETWDKIFGRWTIAYYCSLPLLEETVGYLLMGFLSLLNRAKGERRSIAFHQLEAHDVVVLVDNSTPRARPALKYPR